MTATDACFRDASTARRDSEAASLPAWILFARNSSALSALIRGEEVNAGEELFLRYGLIQQLAGYFAGRLFRLRHYPLHFAGINLVHGDAAGFARHGINHGLGAGLQLPGTAGG